MWGLTIVLIFQKMEPCLMTALSGALGGDFAAIKADWVAAYGAITGLMADAIEGK